MLASQDGLIYVYYLHLFIYLFWGFCEHGNESSDFLKTEEILG
jgi:hypothetical protein